MPNAAGRDTLRAERLHRSPHHRIKGVVVLMVKPAYLFLAFLGLLIFVAILVAFVALPDSGPFDRGDTPSLVTPGAPGVKSVDK
jgi:hypothetical protein